MCAGESEIVSGIGEIGNAARRTFEAQRVDERALVGYTSIRGFAARMGSCQKNEWRISIKKGLNVIALSIHRDIIFEL